jgi:dinuclear metal center YbgI/SA1388 family protein
MGGPRRVETPGHRFFRGRTAVLRDELASYLDQFLDVVRFRDYAPNGLQVEGREDVRSVVSGVSASMLLLEAAAQAGADAVLVHHGWFWRSEDPRVTGIKRRRLAFLLEHAISLYAYHLPLDAHPEVGNNAQLALRLGFIPEGRFGDQEIAWYGRPSEVSTLDGLAALVEARMGRRPLVVAAGPGPLRRVAWCTGAAQDYFPEAIRLGVDAFISGEISEHTVHAARESGVAYLCAGHHATERYGVQALGEHIAGRFGIEHRFVDIGNPV